MNTQAVLLLAAGIIAGGALTMMIMESNDRTPDDHAASTASVEQVPADGNGASSPKLVSVPDDHQAARTRRELDEAKAEIQRLKEQVAGLAKEGPLAPDSPALAKRRDRFLALSEAYGTGTATREDVAELIKLSKDKQLMALVVKGLNDHIGANPDDLQARMQLAEVQSARVHSAESITERAGFGRAVGEQIQAVLERDPEHWDARFMKAVGISHSQRTPQGRATAVREFESLIALQQSRAPEARFAGTYGELATVHLADRNIDKARAALQQGLERYPDSKALRDQLAKLPKE